MKRFTALLLLAAVLLCGCGEKEPEETTLSGMVVSLEGTTLSLVAMDSGSLPSRGDGSERPTMPEGETRPQGGFGGERPTLPEGETMPEGGFRGQWAEGQRPTMPEGETRPDRENNRGQGNFEDMETTQIDIADAHITLEKDEGNASGTLEDLTRGSFVTVTLKDGKATRVVVTQNSFGGGNRGNRGDRGDRTDRQQNSEETT